MLQLGAHRPPFILLSPSSRPVRRIRFTQMLRCVTPSVRLIKTIIIINEINNDNLLDPTEKWQFPHVQSVLHIFCSFHFLCLRVFYCCYSSHSPNEFVVMGARFVRNVCICSIDGADDALYLWLWQLRSREREGLAVGDGRWDTCIAFYNDASSIACLFSAFAQPVAIVLFVWRVLFES